MVSSRAGGVGHNCAAFGKSARRQQVVVVKCVYDMGVPALVLYYPDLEKNCESHYCMSDGKPWPERPLVNMVVLRTAPCRCKGSAQRRELWGKVSWKNMCVYDMG